MYFLTKHKKTILISAIHAVGILLFSLYTLGRPKTFGDEKALLNKMNGWKSKLFPASDKVDKSKFLCIDVSSFRTLIDDPNGEFGEKQIITDRKKLAELFQAIQASEAKPVLVLVDILFDQPSPGSSIFEESATPFHDQLITISHWDESKQQATGSIFPFRTAMASYFTMDDGFYKYPLFINDTLASVPVVMDEMLNQRKYEHTLGNVYQSKGAYYFGHPIIDYSLYPKDLLPATDLEQINLPFFSLGEIVEYSTFIFTKKQAFDMFHDKIIVIGDYSVSDQHSTPVGAMPGPLILLNSYLSIVKNQHVISAIWLFFLWFCFFLLSLKTLGDFHTTTSDWLNETIVGKWVMKYLSIPFYVTCISILSYFIFGLHVSILFLSVYLHFLKEFVKQWKAGNWKNHIKEELKKVLKSKIQEKVKL